MSKERVLIVDDEEENIHICIQILESAGYEVKGVTNGQAAIDLVRKERFDLLLTDFRMPGLDGMETFRAIKEFNPEIVGIVITAYGALSMAIEAVKLGFHGFITKPFTYEELTTTISQALERSRLDKEIIAHRRINKLKDDFLALVSHELRTPLSIVLSSIGLIIDIRAGKANKREREILSILKVEGNRLSRLISNLILMSELKSQEDKHPREWFNISNMVTKAVASVQGDAHKRGIFIDNQVSEGLPGFYGVNHHIKQVVVNLLDNAIKFNREGGRVILKVHKEGGHIRFEVEDTGIGISEDDYTKIFNPFQQVEDPMTRKVGGAGLGLSINKEVVEAHGGEIWVESVPNGGSKFVFTLPLTNKK